MAKVCRELLKENLVLNKKCNWAFIGTGNIAKKAMAELSKSPNHNLTAVHSRKFENAQKFAQKHNAVPCKSFEEAVNFSGVDCVYIATPHQLHYQQTYKCLKLKKPVLCEKPITINFKQMKALELLHKTNNTYLAEAMWARHNPITKKVLEVVKAGKIGKINTFVANFSYNRKFACAPKRVSDMQCGGGALLDLGVYCVAYAQMLFGMPDTIESVMYIGKEESDECVEITLKYSSGTVCKLKSSLEKFTKCSAKIVGERGSISLPFVFYKPNKAILKNNDGATIFKTKRGYIYQFNNTAQDVLNGNVESKFMPVGDSCQVMHIIDKIKKQNNFVYNNLLESVEVEN